MFSMYEIASLKFIYSEKAAEFCETFTLLLSYVVPVKSKVKISQNFVAFLEYMNFTAFIPVKECREFTLKFFFICLFYVDGDVSVSISIIYNVDHTCFFLL